MTQPALSFDLTPPTATRPDPPVVQEIKRLNEQAAKVLARLECRYALNTELNDICFRYGARLMEIKAHGHVWFKAHVEDGLWVYWIKGRA